MLKTKVEKVKDTNNEEDEKMRWQIEYSVEGMVLVTVEAEDVEEARKLAEKETCDMDFGPLENLDWEEVSAEAVE